ncbi:hypothetical protein [Paenibacillus sp. LS1]|uniref:hypothetical protein n=1 Tax=Paenibacillus sp. LS1 TaxID=2992120 RepID=UPI0022312363|nr:hypothetical protein [Paenibacillus sp. LS1]
MQSLFGQQMIDFIKRSDIEICYPEVISVEPHSDGTYTITNSLSQVYISTAAIKDNFSIKTFILFSIIDTYVERIYPELEGKSYLRKLLKLEENRSLDGQVLHDSFRLYKLLRNATIHNTSSINLNDAGDLKIRYTFNGTEYEMEITSVGLGYQNTLIYDLIDPFERRSSTYSNAFRLSLLTMVRIGIHKFNDEKGNLEDMATRDTLPLATGRRYRLDQTHIERRGNLVVVKNPYSPNPSIASFSGVDYTFTLDGHAYFVPSEALDKHTISLEKLKDWQMN